MDAEFTIVATHYLPDGKARTYVAADADLDTIASGAYLTQVVEVSGSKACHEWVWLQGSVMVRTATAAEIDTLLSEEPF